VGWLSDAHVEEIVVADGSKDITLPDPEAVLSAADAIMRKEIGILDVVQALWKTGFEEEAGRVLAMGRARVAGDYLQTAAIFDEQMNVLSKVTDPNDYQGPGTGYAVAPARREEMAAIRQQRSRDDLLARHAAGASASGVRAAGAGGVSSARGTESGTAPGSDSTPRATRSAAPAATQFRLVERGESQTGADPSEVCVGLSPAFATRLWLTMAGLPVGDVLAQIVAGIEEEGCTARLVRVRGTVDVGMIGLTAAKLSGSGIGVGLQAKGTALIHRRDLPPLACLELFSIAPLMTADLYRELGRNAGRHARGLRPVPVRNPYTDQAIEARYHAEVVSLVAVERGEVLVGVPPVDVEVER
jgi:propanediol dehydratase large subunit